MAWTTELLVSLIVLCVLLYKFFTRNFDYWEKKKVPFMKPIPIFGNAFNLLVFKDTMGDFYKRLYDSTTEPFLGFYISNNPCIVLRSLDLFKSVLTKDFSYFDDRTAEIDKKSYPFQANFMFFSKNPDWRNHRSKISPIFTTGKLKNMFPLMNDVGEMFVKHLKEFCKGPEPFEAKDLVTKFTSEISSSCFFGIDGHSFDKEDAEIRAAGKKFFDCSWLNGIHQNAVFSLPFIAKLLNVPMFSQATIDFLLNIINKTMSIRKKGNFRRNDMIDLIMDLQENKNSNNVYLTTQLIQFFIGGFETTSSTVAFTLYELAMDEDTQKRLSDEIKDNISQHGGITYDGVKEMKYLHQCISETLRKYPVLSFLDRKVNADYKIPGTDVVLEKGTAVYIPMLGVHMDEIYYPNPDKYDPDRFSPERIEEIPQYAFLPFGQGPRICIGERFGLLGTKLCLVHLLRNFQIEKSKKTPDTLEFDARSVLAVAKDGIYLHFKQIIAE